MKKYTFLLAGLLFLILNAADAQKYAVYFKNKTGTPYTLDNPSEFLSQRALERRMKFNIILTEEDLPVNPDFIRQVKNAGAEVVASSKWINCALVTISDAGTMEQVKNLECVEQVVCVYSFDNLSSKSGDKFQNENTGDILPPLKRNTSSLYGEALNQIKQLNGIAVHEKGYQGEGVVIAVLDAGFANADKIEAFEHLFTDNRIWLARDVVEPNGSIYASNIDSHGTLVLSCMGAYLPNEMIGTAPKAAYCLIRTEDNTSEYLIEEYNWVIGAEIADSIGADIINSSLSYTTYDNPVMNHAYQDMDGKTAVASIGAQKAVERGIFVCVSAGNTGNSSEWPWIGTPADVNDVLTVGAVQSNGVYASFSSIGPNAAGEQKPNVMAQGRDAAVVYTSGEVNYGSGTSFSSPIICGMVACILQACPDKDPVTIKNAIEAASSWYGNPTPKMGYGIPDFEKTLQSLPVCRPVLEHNLEIYPNPAYNVLYVKSEYELKTVVVYDIMGRLVFQKQLGNFQEKINIASLSTGLYILQIYDERDIMMNIKVIKR